MPYKYIGRRNDFKGKTLWEILGNLKNFGVGRLVIRSRLDRYPEPSYYKILKVEALPNPKEPGIDNARRVRIQAEKIFRGKLERLLTIETASYKADYVLIPKDEEETYIKRNIDTKMIVLPKYTAFPPLLREFLIKDMEAKGEKVEEPKMEIVYALQNLKTKKYRVAEEGEEPDRHITPSLGVPIAPRLYKGIKL